MTNTVVADGSYASQHNMEQGRAQGIKRLVFHKKKGIKISQMGVKQKTYDKLKHFKAGVEGNISVKRVFGLGKATWKGYEGFHAYVLASAIAYNLSLGANRIGLKKRHLKHKYLPTHTNCGEAYA